MKMYRVPELAKKYFEHEMIESYTELPKMPDGRAELLYMFLNQSGETVHRELLPLATTIVQVGLDTHDMVDALHSRGIGRSDRTTQLRVLAGDYFSGRFYELLSQAGLISWIRLLSSAICDLNRLKVNFYVKMKQLKLTAEEYVRQSAEMKSALFLTFTDVFDGKYKRLWPELLDSYTRCEVLVEELERTDNPDRFRNSWAYWHVLQQCDADDRRRLQAQERGEPDPVYIRGLHNKYGVHSRLLTMLDEQCNVLMDKIRMFESDKMIRELSRLMEPFTCALKGPKVLEEI